MQHLQSSTSVFESSNFTTKLSDKLLSFSENKTFSDICIVASDDVPFHAHKCVLSAFSDYFMAMFTSGLKEASATEVKIHEIDGKVLKPILNFLYTGRIELKNETIENILRAANFFQIQLLIYECYNFMAEKMDVKNCLGMAIFADQNGLIELFKKATKFASANFERVCNCSEFLRLEEDPLSAIVSSEDLCVTSEEAVFFGLIKWIEHDRPNREKSAVNLFSKVRYWLLSPEFIREHRSKISSQFECLEMVCTWLEWHSLPDNKRALKPIQFAKPKNRHGILFIGGGGIQTYDPDLSIWTREDVPELPRFDKFVVFKNKLIFSFENEILKCFDPQTKEISNLPRMNTSRYNYGLAVLNDEVYVIGGHKYRNPGNWIRVNEKYNYTTKKWHPVAPMNNILSSLKVAVANGQLYVIGHLTKNGEHTYPEIIEIMEYLHPITNKWTSLPFLEMPINIDFGFAEVGGDLYKIGGKYLQQRSGNYAVCKSLQCYQPFYNKWVERKQMNIPLFNPHCISWNNRLITCGGLDESGTQLNIVQEYNPRINEWRTLAQLIEYNYYSSDYFIVALE